MLGFIIFLPVLLANDQTTQSVPWNQVPPWIQMLIAVGVVIYTVSRFALKLEARLDLMQEKFLGKFRLISQWQKNVDNQLGIKRPKDADDDDSDNTP